MKTTGFRVDLSWLTRQDWTHGESVFVVWTAKGLLNEIYQQNLYRCYQQIELPMSYKALFKQNAWIWKN